MSKSYDQTKEKIMHVTPRDWSLDINNINTFAIQSYAQVIAVV